MARPLTKFYQYEREKIRQHYAKYGRESLVKAGVCWPNKEELAFQRKFEETFYPSLNKLMEDMVVERKEREKEIQQKEKEFLKGMAKKDKLIQEFRAKQLASLEQEEAERKRQEKIVAEVREYLGFNIDQSDARFQEALAKKEEDERAMAKKALKKDKKSRTAMMLQQLLGVSEEEVLDSPSNPPREEDGKMKDK
ncbi:growth arrest and DNA damage-inducible proteins-interacting protein CRIF [Brevipalpus obovatus]|uniref:growth arrest and DNA damage-inducible proteins-interacting protein CRIF n=1 Tax=Brevipalpus obovatus TaxID=246614 RepID=UPI003D9E7DCC